MTTGLTLAGVALILIAMRDVVHELFHPEATGSLSRILSRWIWGAFRFVGKRYPQFMYDAGPAMLIGVGTMWLALVTIGAAMIDLPRLPRDVLATPGLPESARHGPMTALYMSLASLTSVGAGGLIPAADGVRILYIVEPVLGLVLISAWITWVLSIFPIIGDRRAFERHVDLLRCAEPSPNRVVDGAPREAVAETLRSLSADVIRLGSQLAQARVTYYFHNREGRLSLAVQLPYLLALGEAAEHHSELPLIRYHGATLRRAVERLIADLGDYYLDLSHASPQTVLDALARDHLQQRASEG